MYNIFCQDFHEEYAKVAFKRYDPEGTGFISALDFNDIILSVKSHLLTSDVKANLIAVRFWLAQDHLRCWELTV